MATKNYELIFLVPEKIGEDETRLIGDKISEFVSKEGGAFRIVSNPAKKRLGSKIKKNDFVFQISAEFELDPEKIAVLEKELKTNPLILRYILLVKRIRAKEEYRHRSTVPVDQGKIEETSSEPRKIGKVELKEIDKKLDEMLGE